MHNPKTLEEAISVIDTLSKKEARHFTQMILAKARLYDFLYGGIEEPETAELKARIVYLEDELKKLIKQRENLKRTGVQNGRNNERHGDSSNTERCPVTKG